jgi:hypothetical protein
LCRSDNQVAFVSIDNASMATVAIANMTIVKARRPGASVVITS